MFFFFVRTRGGGLQVTEENKREYVARLSEHYVCGAVRRELSAFLRGFHELVRSHRSPSPPRD